MKRIATFLLLASLCASTATFAKQPICPSVASIIATIKAEGFDLVKRNHNDPNGGWVVAKLKNKFDTDSEWTFAFLVGPTNANEEEAIAAAYTILPTLRNMPDPFPTKLTTNCLYQSAYSWWPSAGAINPPLNPDDLDIMTKLNR